MSRQPTLFDGARMQMDQAMALTVASLREYGARYRHWAMAWSKGKDSTTLVTLVAHLIESGQIPRPASLTILCADTRMELLPLDLAARSVIDELAERGIGVRTVTAPVDDRYFVYMLGRGVPPPNNMTMRWCTRLLKKEPMERALEDLFAEHGEKILMLTGVREGESAARDGRIALSCSRDGGECGQGWYQQDLAGTMADTLAPLLHWRVCHVFEWLRYFATQPAFGDWSTRLLADVYGGDEAEEINARTGCLECPLVKVDKGFAVVVAMPQWAYLAPLHRLRALYESLRMPLVRLRKAGGEKRADGTLVKNQHRMGPITLEARLAALETVLGIQREVNEAAVRLGRPLVDLINAEEEARIRELIAARTWPQRWEGDEPLATAPFEENGQPSLFDAPPARGGVSPC